ncbi:MAG: methyl-accepting chemotaxis protein, partial [Steroidobacteraceae bacterium]|nr:methyl-accepting chemotaxis protein [Steroidobacteraceae bacterium]
AVMQMDTTTQQNAALVEEAAAASQAIVEQAQALNALVSRYDVGGEATDVVRTERRSKDRPWTSARPAAKATQAKAPVKRAVANGGSDWSEF